MAKTKVPVSPILKWAGGKRQLLDVIIPLIPKCSTYYEPFVGGGAVLFELQPKKAVINDSNADLINVYRVIRDKPEELVAALAAHRKNNSEDYFYTVRAMDRDRNAYYALSDVDRAARIIYLNKTCYNGLYRVNARGEFNTPWGKYDNPDILGESNIAAMHHFLNAGNLTLKCGDYREALKYSRKGAFVYLDPPYMPLSASSSFTSYTAGGFGTEDQIALKKQCDKLDKKGVKFLLSNSCCEFIEELYRDYRIDRVPGRRSINADADRRGAIDEVLIRNYECD